MLRRDSERAPVPPPRFFTLPEMSVLCGEHPAVPDEVGTRARLNSLVSLGASLFVDLTSPSWENVESYAKMLGRMRTVAGLRPVHLSFPIRDVSVPSDRAQMTAILDAIDAGRFAGETVYVHCRAGIGRTGLVAGCLLRRHGESPAGALRVLRRAWRGDERSRRYPRIPQTDGQEAYVKEWLE